MKNTSAWAAAHAPAGTRRGKKALSLLLSLALCLGLLPGMALAEGNNNTDSDTPKAIQLGTDGLLSPSPETTDKGTYHAPQSYVYFGVDATNPIQWRVLDADEANNGNNSGIFLLSENALTQTAFNAEYHEDGEGNCHKGEAPSNGNHSGCIPANQYQGSDAQLWCSGKVSNDFSDIERAAMLGVAKDDAAILGLFERSWGASSLTVEDKLFFLSVQELYDHVGTYDAAPGMAVSSQDYWWLRTPRAGVDYSRYVGCVTYDELQQSGGVRAFPVNEIQPDAVTFFKARPAFNLNKNNVLMISDFYANSKTTGDVGQLTPVGEAQNVTDENTGARAWKLTLKDSSRGGFTASVTAVSGDTLTVNYANAATGENEYLSALVQGSDGTVKFYGHILKLDTADKASGTASITLPEGFNLATDRLFVYSEQCHTDARTDYASELRELELPDYAILADVTALDFGSVPMGFTAVPAAKPVTITNTGTKEITVTLPTSTDYVITAVSGFTSGKATLDPSETASFTVRPFAGRDSYGNTLTVLTNKSAQCEIKLSFARSDTRPTKYAQVTLKNDYDYGIQLLFCGANFTDDDESRALISPMTYDSALHKLPENADGTADTTNVVGKGSSLAILIPAGTYDYYATAPTLDRNIHPNTVSACGINDVSFKAGKHYTITVSANSEVSDPPEEETILPIYTVTAYGLYGERPGFTSGETYTNSYIVGETVDLPIGTREGYTYTLELDGITESTLTLDGGQPVLSFTMPEKDVTVTVNWVKNGSSSGGGSVSTYAVSVGKTEHGSVTVSPKSAAQGATVTVTVAPDKGYALETLTATDKDGKALTLTKKSDTQYSFSMPASDVTVTASFLEDNTMLNYFVDVKAGSYCYDAVLWAAEQGITLGTDAEHFSPSAPCTRAQIVTFLWRAAGSPAPKAAAMPFTDVRADSVYAKAILWAVEQGITLGTTETTFSPDAPCTRAQAVMFLFRYAAPEAVTLQELVSGYADAASVPGYALPAMNWALAAGILRGDGQKLMPGDTCTRGQIVTFLHRALAK